MADERRPSYCPNCGSPLGAGGTFCGTCGARVSGEAAPSGVSGASRRNLIVLLSAFGVVAGILLIVGAIVAFNLLGAAKTQASQPPGAATQETSARQSPAVGNPVGAESGGQSAQTSVGRSTQQTSGQGGTDLAVGDTADVSGVRVTLNGVRSLPKSDENQPTGSPNNTFLATDLTFENTTGDSVPISSLLEFRLRDENGYSASQSIHTQAKELPDGSVSPGQKVSGEIVYEVPQDSGNLQLDYSPGLGSENYTWRIGDPATISGPAASATSATPSSVVASATSASAPDASGNSISYDAENVSDGDTGTAWNVDGDGIGQSVTLNYSDPVTVRRVGIVPGYDKIDSSDGTYRFYQLYVVKRAKLEFSDGSSVEADFQRDPEMQYTDVPDTQTNYVRITIEDTYPPGDSPDGETYPYTLDKAAISEVSVEGP